MSGNHEKRAALKAAFPHTVPILTGFAFLGMVYGMLMASKGYGAGWSLLMSMVVFGGSIQYVAVTLLTAAFNPIQALILSLTINARHLFYGISMLKKYTGTGRLKYFLIFALCDETYSLTSTKEPPEGISAKWFYFWITFLDYSYWVIASFAGGLLGGLIRIDLEGLDFVLTALFVVLFLEQWREKENRLPAAIGLLCSVISLVVFGADNFIIPAMILLAVSLLCGKSRLSKQYHSQKAGEEK
ncbi:AzlC family ABC transporter permease [Anaerovorax odorimutans]|uniref:AzlC family ABC transporter permease n=1 Tax=Anaerovorax odorimutans TaxID=109327 RepID=A0ABT1RRW3_9FIRM|nr:AzlC family ABC transporter permease [Anaerovorax odorimutans]MCQ4637913.1 AzlC family ABC transporter permease [Anaerovorax odorimutans]